MRIDAEARATQTKILQEGQAAAYIIQKQAEADGLQRVAEGEAAGTRAKLNAEASGIQAKLTAEAEGTRALLDAKAQGFEKLLKVADDTAGATQLLIAENIVRIAEIQSGAIKGLQFEKVIVMGGGNGSGGGGGGGGLFRFRRRGIHFRGRTTPVPGFRRASPGCRADRRARPLDRVRANHLLAVRLTGDPTQVRARSCRAALLPSYCSSLSA